MEEPYKEMYMQLYRNMEFMHKVLEKLGNGVEHALDETVETYLAHFQEEAEGKSMLEKRFKKLFQDD